MQDIPDEVLLRAAQGDRSAFEQIYRNASGFVYSLALRVTRNKEEAEEVTQDVFVKVHRALGRFRMESSFKTWIYRIAVNTALEACRRHGRRRERVTDGEEEITVPVEPEIETVIRQEHAGDKVRQLLAGLNPEQRACLVLREIEGLSYEEIARALNANINTVRTRLKRARETLMTLAKKEVMGHEL